MSRPHDDKAQSQHLQTLRPAPALSSLFAVLSECAYNRDESLASLADTLGLSRSTFKRFLSHLRVDGVIAGRLGNFTFNYSALGTVSQTFSSAIISCEPDIRWLRRPPAPTRHRPYSDEEGLVRFLAMELPRREEYRNRVIVERALILIGDRERAIELTVHAASTTTMFSFARHAVEVCDGLLGTRTLPICYSVAGGSPAGAHRGSK